VFARRARLGAGVLRLVQSRTSSHGAESVNPRRCTLRTGGMVLRSATGFGGSVCGASGTICETRSRARSVAHSGVDQSAQAASPTCRRFSKFCHELSQPIDTFRTTYIKSRSRSQLFNKTSGANYRTRGGGKRKTRKLLSGGMTKRLELL